MTMTFKGVAVLAGIIITCAAMTVASGCATPEASAAATNSPPPQIAAMLPATNAVVDVITTNVACVADTTNVVPSKVVYPDISADDFCVEDWAEELAAKAVQGLHVRNGHILVVVRIKTEANEDQTLTKLRAKFRAIGFLRWYFPNLPKDFSAPCRVLVNECSDDDGQCIVVMLFKSEVVLP